MLHYSVDDTCVTLTAEGFIPADEALAAFRAMRDDPNVPDGLPWLMDLRQYDQASMPIDELQGRVMKMFQILGPKLGKFWAIVLDDQVQHLVKGRLLQHLVQGDDATVMLFRSVDEAREWLSAMTAGRARTMNE